MYIVSYFTQDLKEKKLVEEEAENGKDAPANGNAVSFLFLFLCIKKKFYRKTVSRDYMLSYPSIAITLFCQDNEENGDQENDVEEEEEDVGEEEDEEDDGEGETLQSATGIQ